MEIDVKKENGKLIVAFECASLAGAKKAVEIILTEAEAHFAAKPEEMT